MQNVEVVKTETWEKVVANVYDTTAGKETIKISGHSCKESPIGKGFRK
jgi:hypothetical protein